jgi:drug/metabolite transporter (DMT)-like permease
VKLGQAIRSDARGAPAPGALAGGRTPQAHPRRKLWARGQLFAAGVFFGLMASLVRLGSRAPADFSSAQMSTVRFTVGIAMTLGLFWLRPGTFRPVRRKLLFTRGALGGIAVLLYFVSLARIPAGEATLLNNTFPVIATVLSFYTLGERPTVHLAVALAVVSAGVFLVIGPGSASIGLGIGELAGIASAILGAGAVTSIRALRATDNAPTIFFAFCLGGLAVSLPFSFGSWPADAATWGLALAVGVLSFFAQILMTHAYGALTVAEAALWQQLTPIASYAWALSLLDEHLSRLGSLGVLLGIAGVAYGSILGHRPVGGRPGTTVVVEPVDPA